MKGKFRMAVDSMKAAHKTSAMTERDQDGALESALEAHWPRVCATLYRLVGDWGEAEELALEVFYRLHQHPPRDPDRLGGWLRRVATHLGLNVLRARARRRRYETAAGTLLQEQAAPPDPADEVERSEVRRQVRAVLARMRPRAAQLLVLRYGGLSYAEIAAALDVAPGSVGTLLARAEKEFERRYRALEGSDETP
jgi:RNA polymerase sigma-70 factor (ECF subfamily)